MSLIQGNTTTILYTTDVSKTLCSITISQRLGDDPSILILSPDSLVKESLYDIKTSSTMHCILIHNVCNSTYVDHINSVALCMLKARVSTDILVAASEGRSFMIYSPERDSVVSFYTESPENTGITEHLKNECVLKYNELLSTPNIRCMAIRE